MQPGWELEFYETARGDQPVAQYINQLSEIERSKVTNSLERLAQYGTTLQMPEVRRMQGTDLWELRVRGRNQHRVFYVTVTERRIVVLHAFGKKSQRTADREIRAAESRLREYRRRM